MIWEDTDHIEPVAISGRHDPFSLFVQPTAALYTNPKPTSHEKSKQHNAIAIMLRFF